MENDLVGQFCKETGANRITALMYLDLYGSNLDEAKDAFFSGNTAKIVRTDPPHRARLVSQLDLLVHSFQTMAAGEVSKEEATAYLDECSWDLKRAVANFKKYHGGLKPKPLHLCHSPKHSYVGTLAEEERLGDSLPSQSSSSDYGGGEDSLNEDQRSSSICDNAELVANTRFTEKDALDEMIPLPIPQMSSQEKLPSLGIFGSLDQCYWNVDHPKNKSKLLTSMQSDDEKTPTTSLPLMGLPVATPQNQMTPSSQEKDKLKGEAEAIVDQGTTMETSPASLDILEGKAVVDQGTTIETSPASLVCKDRIVDPKAAHKE
ncbi:PREDICTED: uncharacterized protein LOC104702017 [Camelina sativa]|uniref:Uncharacterized protein LOC104702017 n=1 Tax=Camelina sativa TaxID=90675 RepID=A0ABM0SU00_CAMSA|nr:PREDICTED: uncharacterized protein LOC104702017 [Camelina sativa]